jgi:hypothetical protein
VFPIVSVHLSWLQYISGHLDLPSVLAKERAQLQLCVTKGLVIPQTFFGLFIRATEEFVSGEESGGSFVSTLAVESGSNNTQTMLALFCAHLLDGMRHFYMRRLGNAVRSFEQAQALQHSVVSLPVNITLNFHLCLALLAGCPRILPSDSDLTDEQLLVGPGQPGRLPPGYDAEDVSRRLARADALIAQMAIWAKHNPDDNQHKLQLMMAERYRAAGQSHVAAPHLLAHVHRLYDRSISAAMAAQMPLEAAMAMELCGRYMQDSQIYSSAKTLFVWAHDTYARVGMRLKMEQLRREFPEQFADVTLESGITKWGPPPSRFCGPSESASPEVSKRGSPSPSSSALADAHAEELPTSTASSSRSTSATWRMTNLAPSSGIRAPTPLMAVSAIPKPLVQHPPRPTPSPPPTPPRVEAISSSLDALTVLKATSSFATEKDTTKLLQRLMCVTLETAGATRGALILQDAQGDCYVELGGSVDKLTSAGGDGDGGAKGEGDAGDAESSPSGGSPFTSRHFVCAATQLRGESGAEPSDLQSVIPASVLKYVLRTSETLLLSDPSRFHDMAVAAFSSDPYFRTHQPKALLCMPVLRGGQVLGALYLGQCASVKCTGVNGFSALPAGVDFHRVPRFCVRYVFFLSACV